MKADLTHQSIARRLLQEHGAKLDKIELSFVKQMTTAIYLSDRQEAWLEKLRVRSEREAVR